MSNVAVAWSVNVLWSKETQPAVAVGQSYRSTDGFHRL